MNKIFSLFTVAAMAASTFYADMPSNKSRSSDPCACLEQGMGLPSDQKCFPAAYNAPAAISVRDGWDFNAFASFIYWHVSQEGMNLAVKPPVTGVSDGTLTSPAFRYKPGFKVGLGFDTKYDDWTGWVEYTWMHQKTHHTSSTTAASPFAYSAGWFVNNSSTVTAPTFVPVAATSVSGKWKMNLDMLDAAFSRPFYEGKKITIAPFAGLRGLWIRQNYKVSMNIAATPALGSINTFNMNSHSWAVGPMVGSMGHWMMGYGFRFEGKTGASLLYTRYTKVGQRQTVTAAAVDQISGITNLNVLRPMMDLGVGLGWGTYTACQNYYFDLSLRYDFNLLWDQNVMAEFVNGMNHIPGTNGNLYMHGLTVSARFDF